MPYVFIMYYLSYMKLHCQFVILLEGVIVIILSLLNGNKKSVSMKGIEEKGFLPKGITF
jgi:hypothetical protein